MLAIKNLKITLKESPKSIINGISLSINPGEVHLLNGNNGSGKSTLVNAIMGNPSFEVSSGELVLENEVYPRHIVEQIDKDIILYSSKLSDDDFEVGINLGEAEVDQKSRLGIFLASQYPMEIPGVPLVSYLRLIYNSQKPKNQQLPLFKFKELLLEKAQQINYPQNLLKRNLNDGFSGGEKKKTEILQMLILEPRYVMLDEIDSGLDRNSVVEVFGALSSYKRYYPKTSFLIISHYDRVMDFLVPDFIHTIKDGVIVETKKK